MLALVSLALLQGPWIDLFDGKSLSAWKGYKSDQVGPGWKVENGTFRIVDPGTAGDIVTKEKFEWFELTLEFNLGKGQNSGILLRVADGSGEAWHSGPEIQLYDHPIQAGVETTGYLYQLYPLEKDLAKPAGEWNKMRIVVAPDKCFMELNGVRGYEFVWNSPDFLARVAKSKFQEYPEFGKAKTGRIGIQGDHGLVSFRNVKVRRIEKAP